MAREDLHGRVRRREMRSHCPKQRWGTTRRRTIGITSPYERCPAAGGAGRAGKSAVAASRRRLFLGFWPFIKRRVYIALYRFVLFVFVIDGNSM